MRTTLTIDDDVAVLLKRLQCERQLSLEESVNEALRRGLADVTAPPAPSKPFRTEPTSLGRCLLANLDNVAEVLALTEGEDFK